MTTFWPKRDKDGRHIVERARADVADELKEGSYTLNKVTKKWMHEDDFTPCRRCGGDGYHKDFSVQERTLMMICTLCDGACCE